MYKDGQTPIKARNTRYIYIFGSFPSHLNETRGMQEFLQDNQLEEAVLILQETQSGNDPTSPSATLWLSCPSYDRERKLKSIVKKVDIRDSSDWVYNMKELQKPYMCCYLKYISTK